MTAESSMPIAIRPATVADAAGIAEAHVLSWRATYPGIVPQDYLYAMEVRAFEERWRGQLSSATTLSTFVAEGAGTIYGFVAAGPARQEIPGFTGELYAIYLRPEVCGQGLGSRLFRIAAETLHAAGYASMYVWVLADNPSRLFYERMGGKLLTSTEIEIGGKVLTEVSYGWNDLGGHLAQASG